MFKFTYIQFVTDVTGLGSAWSSDKHAKTWGVEEKGSWFIFTNLDNGQRRRVPITSVGVIHENAETKAKSDKGNV